MENYRMPCIYKFTVYLFSTTILLMLFNALVVSVAAQKQMYKYSKSFTYDDRGAGGTPVQGIIVIEPGKEIQFASIALLQTMQELQHGFLRKSSDMQNPLAPKVKYLTDIVPLNDGELMAYNSVLNNVRFRLSDEYIIGVQYELRYDINDNPRNRSFIIELTPILYYKGEGGNWHNYKSDYSSNYFAERVTKLLDKKLNNNQKGVKK